jgi:hypothetical protein
MNMETEAPNAITPFAPPPTLTTAEHMLNVCTIASGLASINATATIGDTTMKLYHSVIDAYMADSSMPH